MNFLYFRDIGGIVNLFMSSLNEYVLIWCPCLKAGVMQGIFH